MHTALEGDVARLFGVMERSISDFGRQLRQNAGTAALKHEEMIRLIAQQRRQRPISKIPRELRRWNLRSRQDAVRARLIEDYATVASSPLFDPDWYLKKYPNVAEKGEDPVLHYVKYGGTYPMSPGPLFNVYWYLFCNPDVKENGVNPLVHFIRQGAAEKRSLGLVVRATQINGDDEETSSIGIDSASYDRWVEECDTLHDADRLAIRRHIKTFTLLPLISVVMPVYNTSEKLFRQAIDSVRAQLYENWELCIADDASPSPHVLEVLRSYASEPRIKWVRREKNGHISAATNSALKLATGTFVALMDHDDILPEHALYEVANEINQYPDVDLIYSDEDLIDGEGHRSSPYFKTDWNRELLLGHNMISHLGVYRRSLVERIGGLRLGFEGSQDYDLALRATDASTSSRIRHIPTVLYHWRQSPGEQSFSQSQLERCVITARRAVIESLARNGEFAVVEPHPHFRYWQRIRRALPDKPPLVSLIIAAGDPSSMLAQCIAGILERTSYANIEIVIIDPGSADDDMSLMFARFRADNRIRILSLPGVYGSAAINAAAKQCNGTLIGLLDQDIDVIDPNWLTEMVSVAILPDVGAVGARLLYPNGRLQHAGVVLGVGGEIAGHFGLNAERADPCYCGRAIMLSEVSAVTGACLLVKTCAFRQVGGLDEINLPSAFADIDFCLRLRERNYRNIYTPHAELYRTGAEAKSDDIHSGRDLTARTEALYMRSRWGKNRHADPFLNANLALSLVTPTPGLVLRRPKPWVLQAGLGGETLAAR